MSGWRSQGGSLTLSRVGCQARERPDLPRIQGHRYTPRVFGWAR